MGSRLAAFAILIVLAVGCGCPAAHDAQGRSDENLGAGSGDKTTDAAKGSVGVDKVDTKVEHQGAAKETAKSKPAENPVGPTYGLPLEIHVDSPEVPERIQGPTPMSALKKKDEKK